MAKKRKQLPKDELIEQLLDDVANIDSDQSAARGIIENDERWVQLGGDNKAYDGPSFRQSRHQNPDEVEGLPFMGSEGSIIGSSDRTVPLGSNETLNLAVPKDSPSVSVNHVHDDEATVPVAALKKAGKLQLPKEKVVVGTLRGGGGGQHKAGNVYVAMDASLAQAENLKIAQQRILELEAENDRYRQENEELSSAAEVIRARLEELNSQVQQAERLRNEAQENAKNEIAILKGNLQFKDSEVGRARLKNEELEMRLRSDFKKIRVKERELENRLELARAEKVAVVRAKDDHLIEMKRKIDQLQGEIDNYREKCQELNKSVESYQEQFKRTVRALRVALTNLEVKDENLVPLKKAD